SENEIETAARQKEVSETVIEISGSCVQRVVIHSCVRAGCVSGTKVFTVTSQRLVSCLNSFDVHEEYWTKRYTRRVLKLPVHVISSRYGWHNHCDVQINSCTWGCIVGYRRSYTKRRC